VIRILKIIYRLFRYKAEWHKQFREIGIGKKQFELINKLDNRTEKLILFFIPGADYITGKEQISGGLISIISLAQETRGLLIQSEFLTLCSTYYNEHTLFELRSFENTTKVFSTKQIEKYFTNVRELIIHIPELFVEDFVTTQFSNQWINKINAVQTNILNQNINLMPSVESVTKLKKKFSNTTITTAHKKYCNSFFQQKYGVPYHQLSVWISPENYVKSNFDQKEDVILFSPDNIELTEKLIEFFEEELPEFKCQIIEGLTYESYKNLITKSKYLITTGEGLDAYFIETYFSGGVAFALKNLNFFDKKYLVLPCLFEENENLQLELLNLIKQFNNVEQYKLHNKRVSELLSEDYSYATYQNNLKKFYNKEYTYA
jgi:hypothetical protein